MRKEKELLEQEVKIKKINIMDKLINSSINMNSKLALSKNYWFLMIEIKTKNKQSSNKVGYKQVKKHLQQNKRITIMKCT